MPKTMRKVIALIMLIPSVNCQELSKKDSEKLHAGEIVIKEQKVKNAKWPIVKAYFKVSASTLECVAVYYALNDQHRYIPKMKESKVIYQVSPTIVHTKHVLDMPWPLNDTHYVNASEIQKTKDEEFLVKWWKVENPTAKAVNGSAKFTPYKGKDSCLVQYHGHVVPDSIFAGIVRDLMVKDVYKALKAYKEYAQKVLGEKDKIFQYKQLILNALNGQYVYDPATRKKD